MAGPKQRWRLRRISEKFVLLSWAIIGGGIAEAVQNL